MFPFASSLHHSFPDEPEGKVVLGEIFSLLSLKEGHERFIAIEAHFAHDISNVAVGDS